ncbi:ATP-binding protein [Streptomyces pseudogriseolus]|uniref:ATP-binding protein n=1 Tax=Streptomyces pseudogriseolus TaxID=36817 RepID=UPI003FA33105
MASVIPSAPLGTDAAAAPVGLGATPAATPSRAAAERRFRFELAAHPGSPAQARRLTRARLTGWSVCEDTCDTAALVVSELVTNAIVHTASSHVVCELHDGDDLLRIAVRDEGCAPGLPRANTRQRPEEEHGRGLLLVDALCRAWGAQEHGPGLLVWAELARTADSPHTAGFPVTADAPRTAGSPRATDSPRTTASGPGEPRGDLGWGARPKPGPAGGSQDGEDDTGDGGAAHPAEQRLRIPAERDGGPA